MRLTTEQRGLVGFWLKAWREGGLGLECGTRERAVRVRFALYGVKKIVSGHETEFTEEVVKAVGEIGLRLVGSKVVGYVKAEDGVGELMGLLGEGAITKEDEVGEESQRRFMGMMAKGGLGDE
jgi:hypothetical protein